MQRVGRPLAAARVAAGRGRRQAHLANTTSPPATTNPTDGIRGTFDQLYPTGHDKLGLADQVGWRNIHHLREGFEFSPFKATPISVNYHSWWLAETTRRPLRGERRAARARGRRRRRAATSARRSTCRSRAPLTPQLQLAAGYAHIFTGAFLEQATPGASYSHPYVMATYVFLAEKMSMMTTTTTTHVPQGRRHIDGRRAARRACPRAGSAAPTPTTARRRTTIRFGIIALTDCAPIVMAHELGYFKKFGIDSIVSKEASWAVIRDKLSLGENQATHMLIGMPLASTMGLAGSPVKPMVIPWLLNRNGQAITLNNKLKTGRRARQPQDVKPLADKAKAAGEPLTFAMTFPPGTHAMWIRYWLASGGINPDKDVSLITIPPPQMVANMKVDKMDGFCVGEPWNNRAIEDGIGFTVDRRRSRCGRTIPRRCARSPRSSRRRTRRR